MAKRKYSDMFMADYVEKLTAAIEVEARRLYDAEPGVMGLGLEKSEDSQEYRVVLLAQREHFETLRRRFGSSIRLSVSEAETLEIPLRIQKAGHVELERTRGQNGP